MRGRMKSFAIVAFGVSLLASTVNGNAFFKRQVSASVVSVKPDSTTSVFTVPTPTTVQTVNGSQHDLSQHFCRIWRHQSVYADGKIYIDGGNTYRPIGNTTFFNTASPNYEQGMNDVLLVLDLSQNFTNQDSSVYTSIDKAPDVPNALIEGVLWYSKVTRKIYQLGGWFSFNSVNDPGYITNAQLPESSIWEFDIDLKTWVQSALSYVNAGSKVDRPGTPANCDAPSLNRSFLFEGYVQQRSDHDYMNYTVSSTFKFLEGMLQLDSNTSPPTLTNISVPNYVGPRMNGAMVYVPIGSQGIIVHIAGQTTANPTSYGVPILNANGGNVNIDNSFVDIYDIETGYWFRQTTFGVPDIPSSRADICTVVVSAPDNSSYNIFMVGGLQTYNNPIAYQDVWVLTLPTFQWVLVDTPPLEGIYGHTCHVVGENLLVVGGMQTVAAGGNANNCSAHMPVEIFSLAQMAYTGIFDYEGASRVPPVPAQVVALVGGTESGGAVVTKPTLWSDLYLQYVFDPALARPAYTPAYTLANVTVSNSSTPANTSSQTTSATPSPSHTDIGVIAGAVISGVVVLALIITAILIILKRRAASKVKFDAAVPPAVLVPGAELPAYDHKNPNAVEVSSYANPLYFAPYQPHGAESNNGPAELNAEEAQDEWRPLQVPPERSPGLNSPSRFSEVSASSDPLDSPTMSQPGVARQSRQSDVSRDSASGPGGG